MYKVKLEQFEGPLDLLLELIEGQKLDITQVSLAKVTDQFISLLNRQAQINPDELADFLVVAAKLLLIKSRVLLPYLSHEEEDVGDDLEKQLKIYRVFLEASRAVSRLISRRRYSYFRETSKTFTPVFVPPKNIAGDNLMQYFREVLKNIEPIISLPRESMLRTISIQEKINQIRDLIFSSAALNFENLVESSKSKTEIIVTFLALLELVKQRTISIFQKNIFSEIQIKKTNGNQTL